MSRCFAYPPPYFGQAQIESIKFDKENLSKDSKAERKRLKKELKKEKKLNESQESKLLKESRKRKYEELGLTTGSSKSSSKHKSKKTKDEQLERSGLSEEHGQASAQPVAKCDSPRSQDSSKRKGGAGAMPSPSPSLTNSGSTIRIKLPGGAKPKEHAQTPVSVQKSNSLPVPKPSAQVTKQNGISAPKPSFQTVKPNGVNNNNLPKPSAQFPKPNGIKTPAPVTKPGIKTPALVQKPNGITTTPQASAFTTSKLNGIRSAPPFVKSNGVFTTPQTSSLAPKQNGLSSQKASVTAGKPNGLSAPKPAAPVARTIPKGPPVRPSEMFAPKLAGAKPVLEHQQKPQPKPVLEQKPQPKPVLAQKPQPKPVLEQKPKAVLEQVKPAGQMRPPTFRPVASKEPVVAPPVKREEKREIVHQKQILPLKRERESFPPPVQSVKTGRLSDPVVRREKEASFAPPAQIPKSKSAEALNAAPSVVSNQEEKPAQALNAAAPSVVANQEKKPVQALNAAPNVVANQERKLVKALNAAPSGVANQEKKPVQAFNAARSVVEKKLAVPVVAPSGNEEKPCFSGRKSETEKKHESEKKRESKHKSKHHHHKHHHKSERKSKRKEELCLYENLMASWQPLPLEEEPEDLDWLLPKRKVQKIEEKKEEDKKEGENLVVHANDGVQNYQTRATFMPEFNMFQLPFVVPF